MKNLNVIAAEIKADWKNVSPAAFPYLKAMQSLESINDMYYADKASSIVAYFLCNAGTWRGEVAKRVKLELKALIK